MFRYTIIVAAISSAIFSQLVSQTPKVLDDVVVTGDVTEILLCKEDETVRIYNLTLKLHAKNIGTRPIIISGADALPHDYKIANTLENLNAKQYAHITWDGPGPEAEPKAVPDVPVKPFQVVSTGNSVDINVDVRVLESAELKPGSAYLQVIAENWPEYSDQYTSKIKRAWSAWGNLWAHSLHSEPIAFVLPNLKQVRCP